MECPSGVALGSYSWTVHQPVQYEYTVLPCGALSVVPIVAVADCRRCPTYVKHSTPFRVLKQVDIVQ